MSSAQNSEGVLAATVDVRFKKFAHFSGFQIMRDRRMASRTGRTQPLIEMRIRVVKRFWGSAGS